MDSGSAQFILKYMLKEMDLSLEQAQMEALDSAMEVLSRDLPIRPIYQPEKNKYFCKRCLTQLPDNAIYCPGCGYKIDYSFKEEQDAGNSMEH